MILRGWRLGVRPRKTPAIRAVHRLCVIALHNYQHAIHLLYSPQHLYIMNRFLLNQIIYYTGISFMRLSYSPHIQAITSLYMY